MTKIGALFMPQKWRVNQIVTGIGECMEIPSLIFRRFFPFAPGFVTGIGNIDMGTLGGMLNMTQNEHELSIWEIYVKPCPLIG